MPRRRKADKKAKESVEILSGALDSVVSQSSASQAPEQSIRSGNSSRRSKKSKRYSYSSITSYAELISAISAGETHLTLGDNIIVEGNILIKQNLIIDFNGFSIVAEDNLPSARILDIRSGEVTLAGKGKIFAMGPNGVAIRAFGAINSSNSAYTVVHVGPDIQLFAPNAYGILISPNLGVAYGLTVNFAGRIFARDGICIANGVNGRDLYLPVVNVKPGSSIVADEASGAALEATGYGSWHIGQARLSGAVGANLKSGQFNFVNSQVIANAGPAFNLIENSSKDLEVSLDKGNYASMSSDLIMGSLTSVKKFTAKGCEFYGPQNIVASELTSHIKPKSSHLHADVAAFLETLIPHADLTEPIAEDAPIVEEAIAPEAISMPEPPELLGDLEITEAPELLSELKIEHPKKSSAISEPASQDDTLEQLDLATSVEADAATEELLLQEFASADISASEPSAPKPDLNSADLEPAAEPILSAPVSEPTLSTADRPVLQPLPRVENRLPLQPITEPISRPTTIIATPQPSTPATPPRPALATLPTFSTPSEPALLTEQEAARGALTDAITEIRRLKPEDYEAGFADLERALRKAEHILASPLADMADIRDASSMLLQAFDSLEERDEFSLSDEELDELFYHGAVLEEVARPQKPSKSQHSASKPRAHSPKSAPIVMAPLVSGPASQPSSSEPDFSVLSEIIATIAGLKLDNYTLESQESLLDELDRAEVVLANMSSSQSEIDEVATSLLAEMSKLERARSSHASAPDHIKISSPAPVVGKLLPSTMIDEMAPATTWTSGITMIDEMNPYLMDVTTREQIIRAMQPWIHEIVEMATEPLKKLSRSIAAGIRAGRHAYRESLHSSTRF